MDPRIRDAIYRATLENGQSRELARKLASWFEAVASGNEDANDSQSAGRHLELAYREVRVPPSRIASTPEGELQAAIAALESQSPEEIL